MEIFAFTLPVGIGERRQNKKTQMEHIFLEGNESWFHLMEGRECSQIRLLRIVFKYTHTRTHRVKESNFLKEGKSRILKIVYTREMPSTFWGISTHFSFEVVLTKQCQLASFFFFFGLSWKKILREAS